MSRGVHAPGIAARRMVKMSPANIRQAFSRRPSCSHNKSLAYTVACNRRRQHGMVPVGAALAPSYPWPATTMLSLLTAISLYFPATSLADTLENSSSPDASEEQQLVQAYGGDTNERANPRSSPAPALRPAYCRPESIASVLSRYQGDIDQGHGGAQKQAELLSFFKDACTVEELQAGLDSIAYSKATDANYASRNWLVQTGADDSPEYRRALLLQASLAGAAAVAAIAIQCWMERPVGWVASQLVEVRPSPVAGKGLFARVDLPEGTVIGAYPGRVRAPSSMQQKLSYAPLSEQYTFVTSDRNYVDPTDTNGLPSEWPQPGWPWLFPTPTHLAYANEPPPSAGGTNCSVKDGSSPSELLFVTCRDCKAGEEIFIDYGRTYDSAVAVTWLNKAWDQETMVAHSKRGEMGGRAPQCWLLLLLIMGCQEMTQALRRNAHADIDLLPGWEGTDTQPDIAQPDLIEHRTGHMKVLHADARIFLWENFISDDDCDHIIQLAKSRMHRSGVVGDDGRDDTSNVRTSSGAFLDRGEDAVVKRHEEKIAKWTLLPVENGEGLQVLRYSKTQEYKQHWDYFFHPEGIANGGNRYATVLCYLADTEEGGETVFPNIPLPPGAVNEGFSECAKYHLAAKPKKGTCVLFHSIKPNGELERRSLHTACPVIKGEKWSAPKWIHVGHYAMAGEKPERIEQKPQRKYMDDVPGCVDKDKHCADWAATGECDSNPGFMVGERGRVGQCLKSCDRCDLVLGGTETAQATAGIRRMLA